MISVTNKSITAKSYNSTCDIIKGITIILVVMGHTYSPVFRNFIYLFHVAVFYIISGFCFNDKYTDSIGNLLILFKKRVISLWLPYLSYNFVFLLLQNIFLKIGILTDNSIYFDYDPYLSDGFAKYVTIADGFKIFVKSIFFMNSRPFVGGLWFLGGLFYVTFLYAIIDYFLKKLRIEKFHLFISLLFLLFGYWISKQDMSNIRLPIHQINIILITEWCFCIGVFLKSYNFTFKLNIKTLWIYFVISFIILLILNKFGTISIAGTAIVNPFFFLTATLIGSSWMFFLAKIIENYSKKADNSIYIYIYIYIYIGKHTIPILALHTLAFKLVTIAQLIYYGGDKMIIAVYPVWKNNVYWTLMYTIVGIIIPLIFPLLFGRNKFCKMLFKF